MKRDKEQPRPRATHTPNKKGLGPRRQSNLQVNLPIQKNKALQFFSLNMKKKSNRPFRGLKVQQGWKLSPLGAIMVPEVDKFDYLYLGKPLINLLIHPQHGPQGQGLTPAHKGPKRGRFPVLSILLLKIHFATKFHP